MATLEGLTTTIPDRTSGVQACPHGEGELLAAYVIVIRLVGADPVPDVPVALLNVDRTIGVGNTYREASCLVAALLCTLEFFALQSRVCGVLTKNLEQR